MELHLRHRHGGSPPPGTPASPERGFACWGGGEGQPSGIHDVVM